MPRNEPPAQDAPLPPPEQAAALLRHRRSVERYRPERPDAALIEAAVECARWAPNHHLTQPWRFYDLGPETAAAVVELNAALVAGSRGEAAADAKRRRWSAVPGWLVATRVQCEDALQAREDYAACCCAVQNLMLYLAAQGIGSKWTTGGVTREPRFYELAGIDPATEETVGLIWYGYPAHRPRSRRRPVAEILQRRP